MKRFIAAAWVLLAAFAAATAQTVDAEAEIKRLLSEGGRAYREGRYVEAQRSFERVRALDPAHKLAPLFIARAAQQQYKPGVETQENVQKAQEAVEAYKLVLASEYAEPKHKEDAYNAVAYLYRQMRDEGAEEQWLLQRANDSAAAPEKRSDAYTILASKQWDCSYNITEQRDNKETVDRGAGGVVVQYKKPKDPNEFTKALGCIDKGMELVGKAIEQNKENPAAWSYKTNLLRERAKLAQMDGKPDEKARYDAEANDAEKEQRRLNALANERKAAEEKTPPAAS
jgi:hypothetical protein